MMPSYFVAHGAPLLALEDNQYTSYLKELGEALPKPKAIVLFSAHWESGVQQVGDVEEYRTIYDFGGFSEALYQIEYPAKGSPDVVKKIKEAFAQQEIPYEVDKTRGLDHGAWVVLRMIYPAADVPVVSMSVNPHLTPQQQYEIGKALAPLRKEDVLIIGSGGTVHNLGVVKLHQDNGQTDAWAVEFDDWLEEQMTKWNIESLYNYKKEAPAVDLAVPPYGNEHFIPIFYAMGAADEERSAKLTHRSYRYGNLSHSVWQFGK
ncbi:dioxygenase family protein [Thalassobacillus devorans]|uniref:dioxygenase family protein n=1 Tax=Thalassobacillus devorans TaxID=279813 RepID=UPI000A1CB97B|nr:class III extradiol ring-cleavage dioxygenase [Thalassobacillus devorans]